MANAKRKKQTNVANKKGTLYIEKNLQPVKTLFYYACKNKIISIGLILIILFWFNLQVNGWIHLKALILDDMSVWNLFDINRNNFFSFIFNTGANKFRPVLLTILFVLFELFGSNIWLFGVFNLMFNFAIVTILFFLFLKICNDKYISAGLSLAYISSRFAYYSISQVFGIMEAMSLIFSILVLYYLWHYISSLNQRLYYLSLVFYTLLLFTHERFMTLILLYALVLIFVGFKKNNILLFIMSVIPVLLNLGLKIFVFSIRVFDGTGGTSILETFKISEVVNNFFSGCAYLFGINLGPTYLNGIAYQDVPNSINLLIFIAAICAILLFIFSSSFIIQKKQINIHIKRILLIVSFIALTLLAGSVTIRLEMRWLYVPYTGLLFLFAYLIGILFKEKKISKKICYSIVILWLCTTVSTELFYRNYYKNIHFWGSQKIANSLFEETFGKYGDNLWEKNLYIICENGELPGINSSEFFKQFSNGKKNNYEIKLIKNGTELVNNVIKDDTLVLELDSQLGEIKQLSFGSVLRKANLGNGWYGWEGDKSYIWTGGTAEALFKTGPYGKMIFEGMIPKFNLPNKITFFFNNEPVYTYDTINNDGNVRIEIEAPKNSIINFKIKLSNFKSPASAGVGGDVRELGVCVRDIRFE